MKRSTNSAPLSLSTSYLIGSAFIGISMMTLNSSGALAPGVTRCRLMVLFLERGVAGIPAFYGGLRRRRPTASDAAPQHARSGGKHHVEAREAAARIVRRPCL